MTYLKNDMAPPSRLKEWPNVPATKGKFYGVMDPVFKKDQLCVMTMDTWVDVGTIIKKQELTMKEQHKTIQNLQAANGALAAQMNDIKERYDNLRTAYREMKRAQLTTENPELAAADKAPLDADLGPSLSYL